MAVAVVSSTFSQEYGPERISRSCLTAPGGAELDVTPATLRVTFAQCPLYSIATTTEVCEPTGRASRTTRVPEAEGGYRMAFIGDAPVADADASTGMRLRPDIEVILSDD